MQKLQGKLKQLARRIHRLNRSWKLGLASSLIVAWLSNVPGQAQTFPTVFDLSTLSLAGGTLGTSFNGIDKDDAAGYSVSSAGDINGDGFDDLIIGAYYASPGGRSKAGESYIVFGRATSLGASFELSSLTSGDGSQGFVINGVAPGDYAGYSVSSAGDVNNDGFDDLIIGAHYADPGGNTSAGESYVIFGRASFGASFELSSLASGDGSTGFQLTGIDAADNSGISVSSAGDVNNDGFDDILIGAYDADPNGTTSAGETYLVFGRASFGASIDLSSLASGDGSTGFVINGSAMNDRAGVSVSSAGDVNNDGFDDILIGAADALFEAGATYVIFGKSTFGASFALSSLASGDGSTGFQINGIDPYDKSGAWVSSVGDVNGDGFDDILIGAPNGNTYAGQSYLVFGKSSFGATFLLSSLAMGDGSQGVVLNGIDTNDNSGYAVSDAGDVNGDGLDDILIGAPGAAPNGIADAGETYLVFGRITFGASIDLSSLATGNGSEGIVINGISEDDVAGYALSSAGDFNGDGTDDFMIGAYGASPGGRTYAGQAYLIFGIQSSAIPVNQAPIVAIPVADQNLDEGFTSTSLNLANTFTDPNNDNLTISATSSDTNVVSVAVSGTTLTLSEVSTGTTNITVTANDNQGGMVSDVFTVNVTSSSFPTVFELSGLASGDGTQGFVINGVEANDYSGISVSNAGDVNGDGLDDMFIGAFYGAPNGNTKAGEAYVVFGRRSGFGASFELSSLASGDGSQGFVINGIDAEDRVGGSVATTGDINNDGFDDLILSAEVNANTTNGEAYVIFGKATFSATFDLSSLLWGDGSQGFVLSSPANRIISGSVASAGDVNGDNFDDFLVALRDTMSPLPKAAEGVLVLGKASGFGANLDLSNIVSGNGSEGTVFTGLDVYDFRLASLASAGDFNNDGFDDILLGSSTADVDGKKDAGKAYVVFGKATGLGASFDLLSLVTGDGSQGFVLNGIDSLSYTGYSVASAGDVNGDGLDDVLVGSYNASPNGIDEAGQTYVVFGSSTFIGNFDLDSLSKGDGSLGFVINGFGEDFYAGISVSTAGDINSDGFDDILIGSYGANPNMADDTEEGESYIVFGRASFGAQLELSSLRSGNGAEGFVLQGVDVNDRSGGSVSNAGDINGDGQDDILIGASDADPNGNNSGETYLVLGRPQATANQAPVLANALADQTLDQGFSSTILSLANTFSDPDNDNLSLSASSDNVSVITLRISGTSLTLNEVGIGTATITVTANDNRGGQVSDTFTVTVNGSPTSVEEAISSSIRLYPQPSAEWVEVEGLQGKYTYTLSDARGKVVTWGEGQEDFTLPMKKMPSGMYFLHFNYKGVSFTKKLIKL